LVASGEYAEIGGQTYFIDESELDFDQSKALCKSLDMNLVNFI